MASEGSDREPRYTVLIAPAAVRTLKRLDRPVQHRIGQAIDRLADEPRPPGVRKLAGTDSLWRLRVGDYRIIYEIVDRELVVTVIRLGHRREIYR